MGAALGWSEGALVGTDVTVGGTVGASERVGSCVGEGVGYIEGAADGSDVVVGTEVVGV